MTGLVDDVADHADNLRLDDDEVIVEVALEGERQVRVPEAPLASGVAL